MWWKLRPGTSTYFASGMCSAMYLPFAGGTNTASEWWTTRVGTRTVGRTARTSSSDGRGLTKASVLGLAAKRSSRAQPARISSFHVRNVASLVDRVAGDPKKYRTLTDKELFRILDHDCRDQHLWALALYGLQRGETAGLRWEQVDLAAQTISIVENRVVLGKQHVESFTPKSKASRRTLPLPDDVVGVLKAARQRQRAERLRFGEGYGDGEYVCSDEMGKALHPDAITSRWQMLLRDLGIAT
jgi:integrase